MSRAQVLTWQINAYDAAYVTLADMLRMPLITADAVLVGKLSGASISVRALASFRKRRLFVHGPLPWSAGMRIPLSYDVRLYTESSWWPER